MQTANKHRISAIPTMLVFKNGKLVDKIIGAYPKATLAGKIQKYL
jgi:thioredoxin 1